MNLDKIISLHQGTDLTRARDVRASSLQFGERVKELREAHNWTLDEASEHSGLSRASISKIERNDLSPTFSAIQKLATGLGVDIAELFAGRRAADATGKRSVTRAGTGNQLETANYQLIALAADLSQKAMLPFETVVRARKLEEFADWDRHDTEDFMYVVEGAVTFYSDVYRPIELNCRDSIYYDGRMGHALITNDDRDAVVLWITCAREPRGVGIQRPVKDDPPRRL